MKKFEEMGVDELKELVLLHIFFGPKAKEHSYSTITDIINYGCINTADIIFDDVIYIGKEPVESIIGDIEGKYIIDLSTVTGEVISLKSDGVERFFRLGLSSFSGRIINNWTEVKVVKKEFTVFEELD